MGDSVCCVLSTMLVEHCALSAVMCDVLPLRNLSMRVANAVDIPEEHLSTFKVMRWDDNPPWKHKPTWILARTVGRVEISRGQ